MSRKSRTIRDAAAFALGVACALTATLTGCQEINTRNDPGFVASADRFVNQTVGPEYEAYVNADPSLGAPGEPTPARQSRLGNVAEFRGAVDQAKQETAETGG